MRISIIVAMTREGAIGRRGGLPWNFPEDLRWFQSQTKGHAILMGRRTFASVGSKALAGRRNIVVTRQADPPAIPDVRWVPGVEEGIAAARETGEQELFIGGGAEIYRAALPVTDRLVITYVDQVVTDADTFFPPWNPATWHGVSSRRSGPLEFVVLERNG